MPALEGTTYDAYAVWERMLSPIAAEVRSAADRPSPLLAHRDGSPPDQRFSPLKAATDAASGQSDALTTVVSPSKIDSRFFDPWFSRTMAILADAKKPGAFGPVNVVGSVAAAEMLAAFMVEVDSSFRPQLMIDDDGCISYGTSVDGFYLNLTVDSPDKITWYAVVDDKEHFEEAASFNGRNLPKLLRDVLQLPTA